MVALVIGLLSLVMILGCKRWRPQLPGVLVAVVAATVAVAVLGLAEGSGLSLVGPLPQRLPTFALPEWSAATMATLAAGAVAIALVSFADTSVLSRTFAVRGGYRVDPTRSGLPQPGRDRRGPQAVADTHDRVWLSIVCFWGGVPGSDPGHRRGCRPGPGERHLAGLTAL